ncbi:MAG: DNA polymerase III subunit delta [Alphaproteobacteria bacterium]|nr:MAG: DNA polymerase III subunit delta [Alphaproteobacteria bacterium]
MTRIAPRQVESFLRRLPDAISGVLIFGPDEGLVRERAETIARQVVEDITDPFRVSRLDPAEVRADPARLADELGAISMLGGRRLVRLRDATDALADTIAAAREHDWGDSLLLVTAGELGPRSRLRRLFEGDERLAALACYRDEGAALSRLIDAVLGEAGLVIARETRDWLCAHLGEDRQASRRELEKLVLYKLDDPDRHLSLEEAMMLVGDGAMVTIQGIVQAVLAGDIAGIEAAWNRALAQGESPIAILRVLQGRFQRLILLTAEVAGGGDPAAIVAASRPPIFFKERAVWVRALHQWTPTRCAKAIRRLTETEIAAKTTGRLPEVEVGRLCLELAALGRPRGRRTAA